MYVNVVGPNEIQVKMNLISPVWFSISFVFKPLFMIHK